MNFSLSFLSLTTQTGSHLLTITKRSAPTHISLQRSSFSRFFDSFLFSNQGKLSSSFYKSKFAHFLSTPLHFSNVESTVYLNTVHYNQACVNLTKCFFNKCYETSSSGGAISFSSSSKFIDIKLCQFFGCLSLNAAAGALFIPNFVEASITKSCFTRCFAHMDHVIHAESNDGCITVSSCTFTENGNFKGDILSHFCAKVITFIQTNTTFNKAISGAFLSIGSPKHVYLKHSYWVSNEGSTAIVHPHKANHEESWLFNNIFTNSIKDTLVTGSIGVTIKYLAMRNNYFDYFCDVDKTSTIHLGECFFDFSQVKLKNKGNDAPSIEYRDGVRFEFAGVSLLKVNVASHDYCWAFKARRPFTFGNLAGAIINRMEVAKHPHMVFFMALFFVIIIVLLLYILRRIPQIKAMLNHIQ